MMMIRCGVMGGGDVDELEYVSFIIIIIILIVINNRDLTSHSTWMDFLHREEPLSPPLATVRQAF